LTAIARVAREQPKTLAQWLAHVAEVEGAKQRVAEHPTPPPSPPDNARDYLHLAAIEAWQAITYRRPAPDMGPSILFREMLDVFGTGGAISPRGSNLSVTGANLRLSAASPSPTRTTN
jgi:hypothetical protein